MEEKVVTISLKLAEWNVVLNALAGRPYAEVAGLIPAIQRQAQAQLEPAQPEAPPQE